MDAASAVIRGQAISPDDRVEVAGIMEAQAKVEIEPRPSSRDASRSMRLLL